MNADFIIGPQLPIGSTYFDQTQVTRGTLFGNACPVTPPADTEAQVIQYGTQQTSFNLFNYYDMPQSLYNTHKRTGSLIHLTNARKAADAWWKHPTWVGSGTIKKWEQGEMSPPPRHGGIGGLILRALDGKPEYWSWIVGYTQAHVQNWLKNRVNDAQLFYGVREGAFSLHYAVWIAGTLPDSFAGAAQIRSQLLADAENIAVNYYGRLQYPDGSWRWDDWDYTDADGGTLKGITQPFMVGLLLAALIDLHLLTTNATVKTKIGEMITRACRHLYLDGPYAKDLLVTNYGVKVRGFHYFYHGGTSVNPSKYQNGDIVVNWPSSTGGVVASERWWVSSARQAIAELAFAYGYAYQISQDATFLTAGNELWDSAYSGTDGFRAMMDDTPKNFNQHVRRAGSWLAWSQETIVPPTPTPPTPIPPTPTPTTPTLRKVPWPSGEAKQNAVVDTQWTERYRFKRHLSGSFAEFEKVP